MRSTHVFVLFLLCAPFVAGCSGGGGPGSGVPELTTASSTTSRAAVVAAASGSSCKHFVSNPECHALPAHPDVSSYSSAWAALEFQPGRARIPAFNAKAGPDPFHDTRDTPDPPFAELTAGGASLSVVLDCNAAAWGPSVCGSHGIQGKTLEVPAGFMPAGNSDHHYSFDDDAGQKEYDFWLAQNVPTASGQTLHVGSGGVCAWSGDGTKCSGSDATNIADSLGSITEADFERGEASPNGSFGHAISFQILCGDPTYVYPASASDGANSNSFAACQGHTGTHARPPEGTRLFLDLSDAQVDAMNLPAYAKAWWRTLDREHEGGFIDDISWYAAPGLSAAFQRDDFSAQAREAGVNPVPYAWVPLGVGTIDMAKDIKFCANGTC